MIGKNRFDPKELKVEKATTRKRSYEELKVDTQKSEVTEAKRKIWEERRYKKIKSDPQKFEVAKAKRKRRDDERNADTQKSEVAISRT
jgi:hypothetical protein